jgi:FeS assembly SUF system regulator
MIRLSKLADYGIVLMTYFAAQAERNPEPGASRTVYAARDLARLSRVPLPTVSKVLKALCRAGLLTSHRGVRGGYSLPNRPCDLSVVDIIRAVDGPIALTDCSQAVDGYCELEEACPVRSNWQKINGVVTDALTGLTLADMTTPRLADHGLPPAAAGYVSLSSVQGQPTLGGAPPPGSPSAPAMDERGPV